MRIHKAVVLLALAALFVWGIAASEEPVKVGAVDLDQALNTTDEGKKASDEIQQKQKEAEAQVQPLVDKYKALEEEVKNKKFVLSEEALYQKQLDLVSMRNDVESKLKQLDNDLKVDAERIRGPLVKKMIDIVKEVGKDEGYTMIFARGAGGMIYNREAIDITDIVVQKFNKKG